MINSIVLYGTFVAPIFTPAAASFLCNPLFLGPTLYLNKALFSTYYGYFTGKSSQTQNIFLLPSGKEVMLETRDGNSLKIRNASFFEPRYHNTKWESRLDFGYGANNFLYARGKPLVKDADVLDAIL